MTIRRGLEFYSLNSLKIKDPLQLKEYGYDRCDCRLGKNIYMRKSLQKLREPENKIAVWYILNEKGKKVYQ